jgi:hypothetical protein
MHWAINWKKKEYRLFEKISLRFKNDLSNNYIL